jgi:hypothetical protein
MFAVLKDGTTREMATIGPEGLVGLVPMLGMRQVIFLYAIPYKRDARAGFSRSTTVSVAAPWHLARHPPSFLHFIPTSCSWFNAVETFFATGANGR